MFNIFIIVKFITTRTYTLLPYSYFCYLVSECIQHCREALAAQFCGFRGVQLYASRDCSITAHVATCMAMRTIAAAATATATACCMSAPAAIFPGALFSRVMRIPIAVASVAAPASAPARAARRGASSPDIIAEISSTCVPISVRSAVRGTVAGTARRIRGRDGRSRRDGWRRRGHSGSHPFARRHILQNRAVQPA